jgi:RimJ/RimL family protein N-acetyltransferase
MPALPALPGDEALVLRSERLDLLPIRRGHARAMIALLRDPALHRFTGELPPADEASLARQYAFWESRRSPDGSELWLNWVVRLREKDELIGHVQASVAADHAYLAWTIGSAWQRRGYATEASAAVVALLRELGVRELRASIHPAHAASIRVAERLGLSPSERVSGAERVFTAVLTESPRD